MYNVASKTSQHRKVSAEKKLSTILFSSFDCQLEISCSNDFFLPEILSSRGNSKHFLPPVNGGKRLSFELSFETQSHM